MSKRQHSETTVDDTCTGGDDLVVKASKKSSTCASTSADPDVVFRLFLDWIENLGDADLSRIRFSQSTSKHGGMGAFAKTRIPPGGLIAQISSRAAMTVERSASAESVVGQAVSQTNFSSSKHPSPEFILWLDMAYGRRHKSHFHHPYLASLPKFAPDAPNNEDITMDDHDELKGTNLGVAVLQARQEIQQQCDQWMPQLQKQHPTVFRDISLDDLRWARGMYYSRRFPPILLGNDNNNHNDNHTSTDGNQVGIMLPVFDLLNHTHHQPITWKGNPSNIAFSAGPNGIEQNQEIYNNYGPKGNEMLFMMYGFCIPDNLHDSYGLQLVLKTTNANTNTTKNLGTFRISRRDSPFPQFPTELWKALNLMFDIDIEQDKDKDNNDNTNTQTEAVEIGMEAVELLLQTLKGRLNPFQSTKEKDSKCDTNIHIYRDGQRRVLEEAIQSLEELLSDPHQQEQGLEGST